METSALVAVRTLAWVARLLLALWVLALWVMTPWVKIWALRKPITSVLAALRLTWVLLPTPSDRLWVIWRGLRVRSLAVLVAARLAGRASVVRVVKRWVRRLARWWLGLLAVLLRVGLAVNSEMPSVGVVDRPTSLTPTPGRLKAKPLKRLLFRLKTRRSLRASHQIRRQRQRLQRRPMQQARTRARRRQLEVLQVLTVAVI